MNRDEYLEKALRALESARILLNHGDPEGAVNRAYYSAFDAAHYALLSENIEYDPAQTRTHNGLITVFSLKLVKTGLIAKEVGRDLNRLQQLRQLADYTGEPIDAASALNAIESVERIHSALFGKESYRTRWDVGREKTRNNKDAEHLRRPCVSPCLTSVRVLRQSMFHVSPWPASFLILIDHQIDRTCL